MIILRKKIISRTIILVTSIVIVYFITCFTTIKERTVETVALPVSGKTVILDAGHGGEDGRSNNS